MFVPRSNHGAYDKVTTEYSEITEYTESLERIALTVHMVRKPHEYLQTTEEIEINKCTEWREVSIFHSLALRLFCIFVYYVAHYLQSRPYSSTTL